MKTGLVVVLLLSAVLAEAFHGMSVSESGQSEIIEVNFEELVNWGLQLPHETLADEWERPEQIRWGVTGGVRGGATGVFRVGFESGVSFLYRRVSP